MSVCPNFTTGFVWRSFVRLHQTTIQGGNRFVGVDQKVLSIHGMTIGWKPTQKMRFPTWSFWGPEISIDALAKFGF